MLERRPRRELKLYLQATVLFPAGMPVPHLKGNFIGIFYLLPE